MDLVCPLHKRKKKNKTRKLSGKKSIGALNFNDVNQVGEWRPFYIPPNIPREPRADLQFTKQEFQNYHSQPLEVKEIIKHMHSKKKTVQGIPLPKFKLKKGKLQKPVKGGKRRKKTRKKRGGHHLYKRLGISKYASQKQIKNSYTKLKNKNKATRKVKEAYKILSNKKTRKQYNNRYKKFVKIKKR